MVSLFHFTLIIDYMQNQINPNLGFKSFTKTVKEFMRSVLIRHYRVYLELLCLIIALILVSRDLPIRNLRSA